MTTATDEATKAPGAVRRAHRPFTLEDGSPIDALPTSLAEAEHEAALYLERMRAIDAQLGGTERIDEHGQPMTHREYQAWRQRAKTARLVVERRYRYLKQWIEEQRARPTTTDDLLPRAVSTKALMHRLTKRVGLLEAVYVAAVAYVDQDTDETWDELLRILDRVRPTLDQALALDGDEPTTKGR